MRITDTNKIERVIEESKKLIVEKGYHGASIAEIAKKANVSAGYLYRHHKNKKELATYIFTELLKEYHEHIFSIIEKSKDSIRPIVEGVVDFAFNLDKNDPYAIKYTYSLIYEFEFEYPESRAEAIDKICDDILEIGKKSGEVSEKCKRVDILMFILTIPVKYTEFVKIRGYNVDNKFSTESRDLLVNMCMNALK